MGKFEERLWSIVRNFLTVAQEDPGLLVTALQVGPPSRAAAGAACQAGCAGRWPLHLSAA